MKDFPEKFILKLTRVLAYIGSFFFLSIFTTGIIGLFFYKSPATPIYLKDVQVSLSEANSISPKELNIPQELDKYFLGENRDILLEWLIGMEEEEIKDFLINLSSVVKEAEKKNLDLVPIINQYKNLKLQRIKRNMVEKWIEKESKLFFVLISGVSILFFLFFGAIILLGSVEKQFRDSQFIL